LFDLYTADQDDEVMPPGQPVDDVLDLGIVDPSPGGGSTAKEDKELLVVHYTIFCPLGIFLPSTGENPGRRSETKKKKKKRKKRKKGKKVGGLFVLFGQGKSGAMVAKTN